MPGLLAISSDTPAARLEAADATGSPASTSGALVDGDPFVEKRDNRAVHADEVLAVLSRLAEAQCRAWVGGGWGVDALAGRQTREHRDVDLAIDAACEAEALATLAELGYPIETDWRPARVELAASDSRWVDLHPVEFGPDGTGRQPDLEGGHFEYPAACFVTGRIAGHVVPCLSIDQQLRFRAEYEPREIDRHDIAVLAGLDPPSPVA
jgi:lincosamide nucleotidyltransferase A/C/D/E